MPRQREALATALTLRPSGRSARMSAEAGLPQRPIGGYRLVDLGLELRTPIF